MIPEIVHHRLGPTLIEKARFGSDAECTGHLTPQYYLGLRLEPTPDTYTIRVTPTRFERPSGSISVVTSVQIDKDGNFIGLVPEQEVINKTQFQQVLRLWRVIDQKTELIVDYDQDLLDTRVANVVHVHTLIGHPYGRIGFHVRRDSWDTLVTRANVPKAIDIPASIHRLVMGVDLQTGEPLTDQSLEAMPLVPYVKS